MLRGGSKSFGGLQRGGSKKFDDKNFQLPSPPPHQSIYEHSLRASTLQICLEKKSKRTCTGDRPSECYRGQNWWGGMCISWNSWWRCSIARTSIICLDWHQKSDFELNSNIHLRHSCNQNMQNIVTWGQNMSANIEEFACISMGRLFSGVLVRDYPRWWGRIVLLL